MEKERERNIERNIHLLPFVFNPHGEPNLQPRYLPWEGIELATLGFEGQSPATEPQWSGPMSRYTFLKWIIVDSTIISQIHSFKNKR